MKKRALLDHVKKTSAPAVLDLFAGCGGLSKGFEQAGFQIVAANEFWEPAQETYVHNHPNTRFFPGDITLAETKREIFNFFKNRKCDVIVGGPPCQAYSLAGLRDPNDPRGRLFEDYVEIVKTLKPKVFVMENVKGILTMNHEKDAITPEEISRKKQIDSLEDTRRELLLLRKRSKNNPNRFTYSEQDEKKLESVKKELKSLKNEKQLVTEKVTDKIVRRFSEIGYSVKFKLLNSANYGVPQKRERVIFIGTRHDVSIRHPEITHCNSPPKQVLLNSSLKPWITVRDAIQDLEDIEENPEFNHIFTAHADEFLTKIKTTPIGKSVFGGYSDAFFRNSPDEPSRTVKENHGGVLVHYKNHRVMTPRELARLQSFPDDFLFKGSKSNILKQIGNAVPPGLAKAIAESIKEMLKDIDMNSERQSAIQESPLIGQTGLIQKPVGIRLSTRQS